ncbi:MAG: hypothetical protein HFH68_15120 [Lachnospiraceae bacterium]|nr:hypothetical protein [Lachnospiraceae bacterium]
MKWMTKLSPKLIIILLPLLAASEVPGAAAFTMPAAVTATISDIAVSEIVVIVVALSANTMLAIIKGYNIEIKDARGR